MIGLRSAGLDSLQCRTLRRLSHTTTTVNNGKQTVINLRLETPTTPNYASERLAHVLEDMIRYGTSLHYYQGLHNIACAVSCSTTLTMKPMWQFVFWNESFAFARCHAWKYDFGNITWLLNVLLLPLVEQVEPNAKSSLLLTYRKWKSPATCDCPGSIMAWFSHDNNDDGGMIGWCVVQLILILLFSYLIVYVSLLQLMRFDS
jgi:hypothetical protein